MVLAACGIASVFWADAADALEAAWAGSALATFVCATAVGVGVLGCPDVWDSTETALLFDVANGFNPVLRLASFSADIVSVCVVFESKLWLMFGATPSLHDLSQKLKWLPPEGFAPIH